MSKLQKQRFMSKLNFFLSICILGFSFACSKKTTDIDPPKEEPLITLPFGWAKDSLLSLGMGKSAAVFRNNKVLNGQTFTSFAFVFDLSDTTLVLKTAMDKARFTPSQWLGKISDKTLALINGGYFDLTNGQSYSVVINDGKMFSPNVKAITRSLNGQNTTYYPTRGAFGIVNKKPTLEWIYNISGTTNYAYPKPSPNALNTAPQIQPTATFPSDGAEWKPTVAIGGSPILIKNGQINISDTAEMIDVSNSVGRSRSAIGYTANNRVIFLVVEKNASTSTQGVNLPELAQMLKDMGCTNALNLDGGGSTCLLVNDGKNTNLPESNNTQRAVTSVIWVAKK